MWSLGCIWVHFPAISAQCLALKTMRQVEWHSYSIWSWSRSWKMHRVIFVHFLTSFLVIFLFSHLLFCACFLRFLCLFHAFLGFKLNRFITRLGRVYFLFFFYPPRLYLSHLSLWWLLLPICYLFPVTCYPVPLYSIAPALHYAPILLWEPPLSHLSIKAYLSGRRERRVMAPFTCW